jgi:hypothetical protein
MRLVILSATPITKDLARMMFCVPNLPTLSIIFMFFFPPFAHCEITANFSGFTVGWTSGRNVHGFGKTFSQNEMHLPRPP